MGGVLGIGSQCAFGARQLFFCDLRYRVAFGSIFSLKFDLIRENYEANATFSANFCFYGCFC